MRRGRSSALGFAVMVGAPPQPDPVPVELDVLGVHVQWRGPPRCPDRDAVKAALEQGDAEAAPDDARVSVEAEIRPTDDRRWSMQAEVASPTGRERRSWIADDCETITRLLVVIVGSALARAREEAPAVATPTPPPEPAAPPVAVVDDPPAIAPSPRPRAPTPAPRERARTELALRITGGIEGGALPRVGTAIAGGFAVARPRWRADAMLTWVMPRGAALPGHPTAAASLQLVAAALRGCARLGRPVEVPLCGGFELGGVLGRGRGVSAPRSDQVLWAALVLGPGLRVPVRRRISLWLDTMVVVPLGRPRFELEGLGRVYRGRTGGRALFGLEFALR